MRAIMLLPLVLAACSPPPAPAPKEKTYCERVCGDQRDRCRESSPGSCQRLYDDCLSRCREPG